jgi:hypothetical protein
MTPQYPLGIPSIHDTNPHLPLVLGDIDLNQTILKGSEVHWENLNHAKAVSEMLRATLSMFTAGYVLIIC